MKKYLTVVFLMTILLSCTKEQLESTNKDNESQLTELQELRKEIENLKAQVDALTSSDSESGVSVTEFEALKAANEELKAQVELLTSGFFEVDGLRFDLNGTLISIEKIENVVVVNQNINGSVKLTTTRTHDAEGRVIEIMNKYSGYNSFSGLPYYWRQELFEYNGKTSKRLQELINMDYLLALNMKKLFQKRHIGNGPSLFASLTNTTSPIIHQSRALPSIKRKILAF